MRGPLLEALVRAQSRRWDRDAGGCRCRRTRWGRRCWGSAGTGASSGIGGWSGPSRQRPIPRGMAGVGRTWRGLSAACEDCCWKRWCGGSRGAWTATRGAVAAGVRAGDGGAGVPSVRGLRAESADGRGRVVSDRPIPRGMAGVGRTWRGLSAACEGCCERLWCGRSPGAGTATRGAVVTGVRAGGGGDHRAAGDPAAAVAQDAVSEAEAGVDAALAASELPVLCNWGLAARIEGKPGSG